MKYFSLITLLFCLHLSGTLFGQELFKSFEFKMPIAEAKSVLTNEGKTLKNLSFGPGTSFTLRKKSLVEKDDKLISINLGSKKNLSLQQAGNYLKKVRAYFESQSYKVVYAQENWSNPVLIKKNLPCIRFVDSNKKVVVEMYPRGQGSIYNVFITFYNYNWFLRKARGEE